MSFAFGLTPCGVCGELVAGGTPGEVHRGCAPVVPSAPAPGPTPDTPAKEDSGPGANLARASIAALLNRLRNETDALLALYLLDHPSRRTSDVSALELIAWAAEKGAAPF